MVLKKNEFYSVKLRKSITIPSSKIIKKTIKGRNALVGTYTVDGKEFKAFKFVKG